MLLFRLGNALALLEASEALPQAVVVRLAIRRPPLAERLGCGQMGSTLTNAPAAKVTTFVRLGRSRPWHFWEYKSRFTEVPKMPLCQKT